MSGSSINHGFEEQYSKPLHQRKLAKLRLLHDRIRINVDNLEPDESKTIKTLYTPYIARAAIAQSVYRIGYGLGGPGIESRWRVRFSVPVQTGPVAHPAYCTMGTGSFPKEKRPRRGVDHPPHLAPRLKEELPLLPLWAFVACSRVTFTFTFTPTQEDLIPISGPLILI